MENPADEEVHQEAAPAQVTDPPRKRAKKPPQTAPTQTMNWYDRTPLSAQLFMQFGFAGLMAIIFVWQFRDASNEARANREMYREEQHALRMEIRATIEASEKRNDAADKRNDKIATQIIEMTFEIRRTADILRQAGLKMEKAADKFDYERGSVPPPREKSATGFGCRFPPLADGPP